MVELVGCVDVYSGDVVFGMMNETINESCIYCNRNVVVLRKIKAKTLLVECLFCGKKWEVDKK